MDKEVEAAVIAGVERERRIRRQISSIGDVMAECLSDVNKLIPESHKHAIRNIVEHWELAKRGELLDAIE